MPSQPDDNEEQHVLVVGETEDNVNRAQYLIEKVIYADDHTRNRIKEEQLKASQEMRTDLFLLPGLTDANGKPIPQEIDDSLMTPYGPPDRNARILPVPNDCVGLIIGKNGETIRKLHRETGCKIQIAKKEIHNTDLRNVFIEGPPEKYEVAKRMIEEIIAEQIFLKQNFSHLGEVNPFPGPHTPLRIPNKMVGLIIGKNGETVRNIHQKTGCFIFIPKESKQGEDFRELELSGPTDSMEVCKREIISMIHLALYGRLPYMNSLFYPFTDPVTGLPIIDPGIMAQLDPNSGEEKQQGNNRGNNQYQQQHQQQYPQQNQQTQEQINAEYYSYGMPTQDPNYYPQYDQMGYTINPNVSQNYQQPVNNSYENFQQSIFDNSKQNDNVNYKVDDYNSPANYDLYYQSLYQMYPQMSDYYKKAQDEKANSASTPFVLFNTGILDPNQQEQNAIFDPNNNANIIQQQKDDLKEKAEKPGFDYSKIDYNKYIDSIYNPKKGNQRQNRNQHNYDKNAVNDNVNQYYEIFYEDEKKKEDGQGNAEQPK
jgi:transcription antitermination factor NusA-like protein